jgi:hypothetical protein
MKRSVPRFNRDERASLAHALMHLRQNDISEDDSYRGWYCGRRDHFIKRHVKAIEFVLSLVMQKDGKCHKFDSTAMMS